MAAKRRTRTQRTSTVTRTRKGRAKGGTRKVTRSHSRTTPTLGSRGGKSTTRKATVKTNGGLKRTAKVSKTTTGSGASRVTKTRRVITRVKNGRVVKRVVTRVNRGGKVTVKRSKPKVSGRGPKSTKPKAQRQARTKRSGGTTALRKRQGRKRK